MVVVVVVVVVQLQLLLLLLLLHLLHLLLLLLPLILLLLLILHLRRSVLCVWPPCTDSPCSDQACVQLGHHYEAGVGVKTDEVEAMRYFQKAADQVARCRSRFYSCCCFSSSCRSRCYSCCSLGAISAANRCTFENGRPGR